MLAMKFFGMKNLNLVLIIKHFSERIIIDKKPEENLSMEVSVTLKQKEISDVKRN